MALLSAADEARVARGLSRFWSRSDAPEPVPFLKGDLTAAVAAINAYLADAATTRPATSINAAYPVAFRNSASVAMKGLMVAVIALAQTGNLDLLRRIVGEVD